MKRLFCLIVFGLMLGGVSMMAENRLSKVGYAGNVGLSLSPVNPGKVEIMTSHGYSFGNGLWAGGGVGGSLLFDYDRLLLTVFSEAKYNFMRESKVSPFLNCKLGFATDLDGECYALCSPAMGIDVGQFSVFASYDILSDLRMTSFGFSFNF